MIFNLHFFIEFSHEKSIADLQELFKNGTDESKKTAIAQNLVCLVSRHEFQNEKQ